MSLDGSEFDSQEGTGVTIPRKAAVFGGGALIVLVVIWFLSRNKTTPTAGTGVDTSGNPVALTADQYNSLRNDFLNGPWSSGANTISAGTDTTSPDGGADGIGLGPPAQSAGVYKAGDVYPAHGETLDQMAALFGDSSANFYYASGNGPLQTYLTNAKPSGGGFSKRGTVAIVNLGVHLPHTITKAVPR